MIKVCNCWKEQYSSVDLPIVLVWYWAVKWRTVIEWYHQEGPNIICKLHKSLYGLKQSARWWKKKLHSALDTLGFQRSNNSIYIYFKRDFKIIAPVFIDDIILVSKDDSVMTSIVQELQQHFKLCDLSLTPFLLSVQIKQDLEACSISLL